MKTKINSLFKQYNIRSISYDSREIRAGDAFFAIKGENFDGNSFIDEALKKGAIVFTDNPAYQAEKVFYVENIRLAIAISAGIIYPKLPKNLIAVTGTNGKSSVVSYIYQILSLLGEPVATLGTLGLESSVEISKDFLSTLPKTLTTSDPISFRKILNTLASANVDNVAFEASSHGIHQNRLGEIKAKTAGFTSFSQDHLDYHGTMEDYLNAKLQLFVNNLEKNGQIVINAEILNSPYGDIVRKFFEKEKINYCSVGLNVGFEDQFLSAAVCLQITNLASSLSGSSVEFRYGDEIYNFNSNIIGSFQAVNLLIAAKMLENIGVDFNKIIGTLDKIKSAPGRLERATRIDDDFHVFVDYAHTPDALEKSLLELKKIKHQDGKLYVVFGCGGDRDPSKRPLMGRVASAVADYVIVTDDNPRSENPQKIRLDILKGARGAEQLDSRELAIENAIEKLKKNDILLIAGKGHENYQIIGDKTLFFSDIKVAKRLVDLKRNE